MRDVADQVAAYMDAVVERVDVEDVASQVTVRPGRATSRLAPRLRWAMAGATAAFTAIGAVAVFEWIARGGIRPFADGSSGMSHSVASMPLWVLAVGAVAAGGLVTAGLFVTFAAIGQRVRERGEKKMQTIERKDTGSGLPALSPLRGSVFAASIIVLVLAVGFGTWLLVDEFTGVDRQIEQLIDEYNQAWETGNGEAAVALMSATGRHYNFIDTDGIGGEELADSIEAWHALDPTTQYRNTGDPIITETTNEYLVMVPAEVGAESAPGPGFSFFVIGKIDGGLEIRQHHWIQR